MKIGVFGNKRQNKYQIKKIFDILFENGVEVFVQKKFNDYLKSALELNYPIAGIIDCDDFSTDIALSIGGDGTFLRTASVVQKKDIPILGINTGRLGFLADISDDEFGALLQDLIIGRYRVEERTQLTLLTEDKKFEGYNYALNEVAVLKQDSASMITIHVNINDEYLTSYQADGLVIATPTGSTAYSMSVGGPILTPDSSNFILTAIAPHSLTARPLVVPDTSRISLNIESRTCNYLVSLDGRSNVLSSNTRLEIRKGHYPLKVVKRLGHTFYETLREKLMWGTDPRIK